MLLRTEASEILLANLNTSSGWCLSYFFMKEGASVSLLNLLKSVYRLRSDWGGDSYFI